MLDQRDILTISIGAAAAAESYITECLGIDTGKGVKVKVSDEQLAAMVTALTFTVITLETAVKCNLRNPELRARLRSMMDSASDEISKQAIDKLGLGGSIVTS